MMVARRALPLIAVAALCTGAASAQPGPSAAQANPSNEDETPENEIVVTGYRDIVVNGRAGRCRPVAGDPLDKVSVPGWPDYLMIVPDDHGGFVSKRAAEQITGPEFWQRVGVGMGAYRFRASSSGQPMCIGGRGGAGSFAGFRRIIDAVPYRGQRLRFTAWVATGSAQKVSFWLAAGTQWLEKRRQFEVQRTPFHKLLNGGNTNNIPFSGNHGWTPVLLETGPIHKDADHISYGFNLQGSGDVWVYDAKLEMVVDELENTRTDDFIMIGSSQR